MSNIPKKPKIIDARHPGYTNDSFYWQHWRETYDGGVDYARRYLEKFSERESDQDYKARLDMTPVPAFAKSAVNDIRNSIFQRLNDVIRRDGSKSYSQAMEGNNGGVDNKGSSMQSFMGIDILTELLIMGRVGIYVDSPVVTGTDSLADVGEHRPYLYPYVAEDILSWAVAKPEQPGRFQALLLRDRGIDFKTELNYGIKMPTGTFTRYRLVWLNETTGKVNVMFYDNENNPIDQWGLPVNPDIPIQLDMDRIPFTLLDIGSSLLKDVSYHQKALLNLVSSDISYALKSNFPFFVKQQDMRNVGAHLKDHVLDDGSSFTSKNEKPGREVRSGVSHGQVYDIKAEQPAFINPSVEPLLASMKLQEKLEDDIRKLVNLAVQNKIGQRVTSAEAMKLSDQGLEAGLSYIGLVLEGGERLVAEYWAAYEDKSKSQQKVALVKYPDRYSLKDDAARILEAEKLSDLMDTVPGNTVKKEVAKSIATALLSGRVDVTKLDEIFKEIDTAEYTTSDADVIIRSIEAGLCGEQTGSAALGFASGEYLKAREDHAARAIRVLQAQTSAQGEQGKMVGARGVDDLATEKGEGKLEREGATDTTLNVDKGKPQRGPGKSLAKGEN